MLLKYTKTTSVHSKYCVRPISNVLTKRIQLASSSPR